jgi:hypothetical protein
MKSNYVKVKSHNIRTDRGRRAYIERMAAAHQRLGYGEMRITQNPEKLHQMVMEFWKEHPVEYPPLPTFPGDDLLIFPPVPRYWGRM